MFFLSEFGLLRFTEALGYVLVNCFILFFVQSDDAAHLEWLSRFVDDSFSSDYPANPLTMTVRPDVSFAGKPRNRRSRAQASPVAAGTWAPTPESELCYSVAKRNPSRRLETESTAADGGGGGGGGARTARRRRRRSGGRDRSGPRRSATPAEFVSNRGGSCRSTDRRRVRRLC